MINGIIYKTINLINNKSYIGKAEQENSNKKSYFGSGIYIKRAIKKYGKENFFRKTIDIAYTKKELNEKERFWIKFYKNLGCNLYNISDGGEGGNLYDRSKNKNPMFNKKHSKQAIKKMAEKKKNNNYGNKLTFYQAECIRFLYKNKKNNKLTYKKLSILFNISFMSVRRIINNSTYKKGEL